MAGAVPSIQRLYALFFHHGREADWPMGYRSRRDLVLDHALRLVPFSGCRVVARSLGVLAGGEWFSFARGKLRISGLDATALAAGVTDDRSTGDDRRSIW
jgi:hypothetical protein